MARPLLMIGSQGDSVKLLQQALNQGTSKLPKLVTDGIFGPKTRARVCEFQTQRNIFTDGIVGPQTWAELEQFITAVVAGYVSPAGEPAARQRIVDNAILLFNNFGWLPGSKDYGLHNYRIAANRPASPTPVPGKKDVFPRQGGVQLACIFRVAGHPDSAKCPVISRKALDIYARGKPPASVRNAIDLPSWCGIFAMHCLNISGLKLPPWPVGATLVKTNCFKARPAKGGPPPQKGDIGLLDPNGSSHHIIIVDVSGSNLTTIEGNEGIHQTIVKNYWSIPAVAAKDGYFLTPLWEKVLT